MKNVFAMKSISAAVVAGIFVLASCSKSNDNPLSSTDSQNVNSESVSSSTANETTDLTNSVMSNVSNTQLAQGRVSGVILGLDAKDGRLKGATITIVGTRGPNGVSGIITIDYGTTGVTTEGVTRKGKIIVTYSGRRLDIGATRTITFSNFSRNSVMIAGSYMVTVQDTSVTSFDITATFKHVSQLTLTFPDNTTLTRNASFTAVWDYKTGTPTQSTITHKAGGTVQGTTRKGATYAMAIVTDLIYRWDCFAAGMFLPFSGSKTITVTSAAGSTPVVYTLSYGSGGNCTNSYTVMVNGKSKTITVSPDGN